MVIVGVNSTVSGMLRLVNDETNALVDVAISVTEEFSRSVAIVITKALESRLDTSKIRAGARALRWNFFDRVDTWLIGSRVKSFEILTGDYDEDKSPDSITDETEKVSGDYGIVDNLDGKYCVVRHTCFLSHLASDELSDRANRRFCASTFITIESISNNLRKWSCPNTVGYGCSMHDISSDRLLPDADDIRVRDEVEKY